MSGAMARIQEIANANQRRRELIKQASATNRIAESFAAAHRSWLERMKPLQPDFLRLSRLQASAKPALCDASLRLAATERLMAGVDFDATRSRFRVEMSVIAGLESSIAHAAASFGGLAESLREISDITRLPVFVLPGRS